MPSTRPSLALCLFVFLFAQTGCMTLDENAALTAPSSSSFKEGGREKGSGKRGQVKIIDKSLFARIGKDAQVAAN